MTEAASPVKTKKKPTSAKSKTLLVAILALLIALAAGLTGYLNHQHQQANQKTNSASLAEIQQTANELQGTLGTLQSAFAMQQTRLNKLTAAKNQDSATLSVVLQLVQTASLNLHLQGNVTNSLYLLKLADKKLLLLGNARFNPIRQSLASRIEALHAVPTVDRNGLIYRIDGISQQINKLTLANFSPKTPVKTPKDQSRKTWWRDALERLKGFVVIHHYNKNARALLAPHDLAYFKQNLTIKLYQAQWAVLHHDNKLYQHNLTLVASWLNLYYKQTPRQVSGIVSSIKELQQHNINPVMPSLNSTIELLQKNIGHAKPAPKKKATVVHAYKKPPVKQTALEA